MSEYHDHHHEDVPRFEPWLGVMACSLVPVSIALFLPSLMVPLIAMTVLLFTGGFVMFRAKSMRVRSRVES